MDDFEDIEVLDAYGEPLEGFYQWDINQTIKIVLRGAEEGLLDTSNLEVHFSNARRNEALVVRGKTEGTDTIVVDVPNEILTEHYKMNVYVYIADKNDIYSQKTILKIDIPVTKRAEPSDYEYVENIERITAEILKQEVKDEIKSEVGTGLIGVRSITFVDLSTSENHQVYFKDGKFMFDSLGDGATLRAKAKARQ